MQDRQSEDQLCEELLAVFQKHNKINGSKKELRERLKEVAKEFNGQSNSKKIDWIEVANNTVPDHVRLYKDRPNKRQSALEYYNEFLAQYMVPESTIMARDYRFYDALQKQLKREGNGQKPGDILLGIKRIRRNIAMDIKNEYAQNTHLVLKSLQTNRELIFDDQEPK